MKVGELRRMLEGLDPEMLILLEVQDEESKDELRQAYLAKADVEIRCDGDPYLNLFGDTNDSVIGGSSHDKDED